MNMFEVSELILWEGQTFLTSLFWGMILAAEYDCIRIFRRVFRHKRVWGIVVEDILYWINAGITVFSVTYEISDGVVRGFSGIALILGALLYRYAFGIYFVKYISKLIIFLLNPLKKLLRFIRMTLKKFGTKIKGVVVRKRKAPEKKCEPKAKLEIKGKPKAKSKTKGKPNKKVKGKLNKKAKGNMNEI